MKYFIKYLNTLARVFVPTLVISRGVGNVPTNFGVSGTFRSLLIDQHLSDRPRYLETLSSCSVFVSSLKFVGLPVRKILLLLLLLDTFKTRLKSARRRIAGAYCAFTEWALFGSWPLTFWPHSLLLVWWASILPIMGYLGLSILELGGSTQ